MVVPESVLQPLVELIRDEVKRQTRDMIIYKLTEMRHKIGLEATQTNDPVKQSALWNKANGLYEAIEEIRSL